MTIKPREDRFQNQVNIIGNGGQDKLRQANVIIIGLGGLGCPLAMYLSAAGIGNLTLIDDDVIELSNLHRQVLFNENDIGLSKVTVAHKKLKRNNSIVHISSLNIRLTYTNASKLISGHDLILDCSDNYQTRYLINKVSRAQGIPLITSAIFKQEGYVATFNYQNSSCLECIFPSPPPNDLIPNCSATGVLGVDVGIAGILQAKEAISLLTEKPNLNNKIMTIKFSELSFKTRIINKNNNCSKEKCSNQIPQNFFESISLISFNELQRLIRENKDTQLVDVRSSKEHLNNNIGGVNIPMEIIEEASRLDKNLTLIIYCQSGCRSSIAASSLILNGFNKVFSLKNGLDSLNKE